jgi:hypothetical protein
MALRRLWFPICLLTRMAGVMLLTRVVRVDDPDIGRYAWSRLRRFLHISEVEERIFHLHRLEARQRANARKQATQIRRCLIQAQEYFEAASAVSLATKSVLFYYCIMSLALAEVLLKQSGMSSLDRAREQNKHHGLSFSVSGRPRDGQMLEQTAGWLVAVPLVRPSGEPFGTFALWHHSSRETPLVGPRRRYPATGGASTGPEIILSGANVPLRPLPSGGISLVECLRNLPGMMGAVAQFGVEQTLSEHESSYRHARMTTN